MSREIYTDSCCVKLRLCDQLPVPIQILLSTHKRKTFPMIVGMTHHYWLQQLFLFPMMVVAACSKTYRLVQNAGDTALVRLLAIHCRCELPLLPDCPGPDGAVSATGEEPAPAGDKTRNVSSVDCGLADFPGYRPGQVPLQNLVAPRTAACSAASVTWSSLQKQLCSRLTGHSFRYKNSCIPAAGSCWIQHFQALAAA